MVAGLGVGFLSHEQHNTGDMLLQTVQHRIMGAMPLLAFSLQLMLYAEADPHASH